MMRSPRYRPKESRYPLAVSQRPSFPSPFHSLLLALQRYFFRQQRLGVLCFSLTFALATLCHGHAMAQSPKPTVAAEAHVVIEAMPNRSRVKDETQRWGKKRAIAVPVPHASGALPSTNKTEVGLTKTNTTKAALSKSPQSSPQSSGLETLEKTFSLPTTVAPGTVLEAFRQDVADPPDYLPEDFFAKLSAPAALLNPIPSPTKVPRSEIRGVWMTRSDMAVLRDRKALGQALHELARLNFNTIYPVIWSAGYTLHPSDVAQQAGIPHIYGGDEGQDILADIIEQAHREGLAVMPWFEYGFMVPPGSELAQGHPDWLTQTRQGKQTQRQSGVAMAWLNPFQLEVQRFMTALVEEVVSRYDVDGVQFDDHLSLPRNFGYDRYTRSRYEQETQHPVPLLASDDNWVKWRADEITAFVAELHQAVKRHRPEALFSLSPNLYNFAYRRHLQDWLTWVRRGWVDELIVQVYQSNQGRFVASLNHPEIREAQRRIPTAIGVLSGLKRRPIPMAQIKRQVQAAQQRHLGISFFFYNSLWDNAPESKAQRQSAFRAIFPNPLPRLALRPQ